MAAVPTSTRLENLLRDGLLVFDRVDLAGRVHCGRRAYSPVGFNTVFGDTALPPDTRLPCSDCEVVGVGMHWGD
jgi:hypothetical protein